MATLLEHLGKDTLPEALLEDFIAWCVWEQARPALVIILRRTGLDSHADDMEALDSYEMLDTVAENAAQRANQARQLTGTFGMSTAEAAAFLMNKISQSAQATDAEDVAFFAVQVCGWQGFAATDFTQPQEKQSAESAARTAQEQKLSQLWRHYDVPLADDDSSPDDG
jgi:hypothetical protein